MCTCDRDEYKQIKGENDTLKKALTRLIDTVDDSLRLDEELHKDWDTLKRAVDTARAVLYS